MARIMFTVVVLLAVSAREQVIAGEDPAQSEDRAASLNLLTESMQGYTITVGDDRSALLELVKVPVLRYSDPVTTTSFAKIADGAVFVWKRNNCPEAVTAIHNSKTGGLWVEFLSLSPSPLTASRMGQPQWSPKKNGVEFKPVDDAPLPDRSPPQRLTQMRLMLRSFSASITDPDSARQELRLLPQPAYRYSQPDRGIIDGAIFVFARSTNPEMLLLLEARVVNGKQLWMYSPARFTGREAELRYRDERVWTHGSFTGARDPAKPFFQKLMPLDTQNRGQ